MSAGFEAVREAFAENFDRRHELGGACCGYCQGEKVVDLWGGVRNQSAGEPRDEDAMVLVYSTTKGLAAMTLALAHSRGWPDYEQRVCAYWPEFARNGKETITVHQKPAWAPGTRQACHAISLGYLEGELLRRVDPPHRSLGQFFQDEIATSLGLYFYIRLPESIPNSRPAAAWARRAPSPAPTACSPPATVGARLHEALPRVGVRERGLVRNARNG